MRSRHSVDGCLVSWYLVSNDCVACGNTVGPEQAGPSKVALQMVCRVTAIELLMLGCHGMMEG